MGMDRRSTRALMQKEQLIRFAERVPFPIHVYVGWSFGFLKPIVAFFEVAPFIDPLGVPMTLHVLIGHSKG